MKAKMVMPVLCCVLLSAASAGRANAQGTQTTPPAEAKPATAATPASPATSARPTTMPPAAAPADVESIDAILAALYGVISGPAGQPRNLDRFRSLFIDGARLIPTGRRPTGEVAARVLGVEEFVNSLTRNTQTQGFFEKSVADRIERFGHIAHVFSTYEARHNADDKRPFIRGINSIQLMNDGKRWWIVTIYWQAEDADNPIPAKYFESQKD